MFYGENVNVKTQPMELSIIWEQVVGLLVGGVTAGKPDEKKTVHQNMLFAGVRNLGIQEFLCVPWG